MKRLIVALSVCLLGMGMAAPCQAGDNAAHEKMAAQMTEAYLALKPLPCPASDLKITKPDQAYKVQSLYVGKLASKMGGIAGYKAGLTSAVAQKKFGYKEAVTGVLFNKGLMQPKAVVPKQGHVRLFIEVELAVYLKDDIKAPVASEKDLLAHVASVAPAIELPDVNCGDLKRMSGLDIIASNVGSRAYIVGPAKKLQGLDLDKLAVSLSRDGKELAKGVGSMSLGGQFKALLWSVNNLVKHSGPLKAGQFIITGSLTGLTPGKPGQYLTKYGPLGEIAFVIK